MSRALDDVAGFASSPLGFIAAVGIGFGVLYYLFFRDKSPLNPENTATDAQGNPVTAYKEVGGPLGWLGAATNKVLGGYPASAGEAIGQALPTPTQAQTYFNQMGAALGCQTCGGTSCTDPVHGVIFADSFSYPAGAKIPTNAIKKERSYAIQSWSARPHQA